MATNKLTPKEIDAALSAARSGDSRRKLSDGEGMYLLIEPPTEEGNPAIAYWRLKYRIDGREKLISFGRYPKTSLSKARSKRRDALDALVDGVDPSEQRKATKAAALLEGKNTFGAVAEEWLARMKIKWAATNFVKVRSRFDNHILPILRDEPVSKITAARLVDALKKIDDTSTGDTARRCRQYINAVFRHAIHTNRLQANPTPHPDILNPVVKGKFAAITKPDRIGDLLRAIRGYGGSRVVQCALQLAPLVFVRPGELRAAKWSEIDLDAAEWRIPSERMKMRREHVVPLSRQAVAILRELHQLTGREELVFPGERSRKRPMSENTINCALRAMDFQKAEMTGHGFRHMASTLLHDSRIWASEVIERQLAHADGNKIRGVYNVAEYLPERVKMMQWWADRLDTLAQANNVVAIRKRDLLAFLGPSVA